tara:strand:- start:1146 stop:1358 length:213 start_codon:yes stop_codon:yes gene_type:complete
MNTRNKTKQIVSRITDDIFISIKLINAIKDNLTNAEIDQLWKELDLDLNALNDDNESMNDLLNIYPDDNK